MSDFQEPKEDLIRYIRASDWRRVSNLVNNLPSETFVELIVSLATEVSILRRGR